MEIENLIKLIEKVSVSGLNTFCYKEDGVKIRMTKKQAKRSHAGYPEIETEIIADTISDIDVKTVVSPLVGIFYCAPAEDAEPYVTVGDTVRKGQVLAIVEAMKLMNEIESDYDGKITEILVKNGQTVEYGQPLFRIQ
ncbi:MAG: acetyl-CoA carboxylase biotin carboxyl carrier protein [Eubacteriales bacterium]|nr:acetyl-CoA carboxylase biotin carboxyl carrier protein [Eubacteriales bacterium]